MCRYVHKLGRSFSTCKHHIRGNIQKFFRIVIFRHGCPQKVLTDQGRKFTSKAFKRICKQYGIEHVETSAYHHQTNGKLDRYPKFLENSIATITRPDQLVWSRLLDSSYTGQH